LTQLNYQQRQGLHVVAASNFKKRAPAGGVIGGFVPNLPANQAIAGSRNANLLDYLNINNQHAGTFNHLAVGKGGTRVVNGNNIIQPSTGTFDQNSLDRI
jgi:hypothetical protein